MCAFGIRFLTAEVSTSVTFTALSFPPLYMLDPPSNSRERTAPLWMANFFLTSFFSLEYS